MPRAPDDWDQHWREFTSAAELGPAHNYRRRTIFRLLAIPEGGKPVSMLEIGSGTGEFAEAFLARYPGSPFLGLELSRVGVEVSSRRVPAARFLECNLLEPPMVDRLPGPRASFAVCAEVLEHLDDPVLLLRNASAYMAFGCKLVVTVPGGPMSAFDRHIGHRKHYTPAELKDVLERAGFTVEAACGAGFPFFNLYRLTILLRGERLRADIQGSPSALVKMGMAVFGLLFPFNLSRFGWQTVAVARYRGA